MNQAQDEPDQDGPPDEERIDQVARAAGRRVERLVEGAIEAELETGGREETIEEAKRHLLVRVAIVVAGTLVVILGIVLMPLPGPGLLIVAAGLGILATEVPFAARLLERVRERLPSDDDGKLPKSAIAMMVAVFVVASSASVWFAVTR